MADTNTDVLDVAIVGGGVSGVYCGWRLTDPGNGGAGRRVSVFEMSDRIGGRLLSVELPGLGGIACELGGMRYMSSQPLVKWLVEEELKLRTEPAPVDEPNNIAYLRGRHLRLDQLKTKGAIPYDLDWSEQGLDAAALLQHAVAQIVPGIGTLSGEALREHIQTGTYGGRPLWAQGFWNLLARVMSREAYAFAQQAGGYDTTALNWNAADTIMLNFDFAPGVTFHRFTDGYEQLPVSLAERFEDTGGAIEFGHRLRTVDSVTLEDGSPGVALTFETGDGTRTVQARNAVLAMPRRSLELLEETGPVFGDPKVRTLMASVTPIPLFKAFVAYHDPWWEPAGVSTGRSVTDLPLRQVYYWGVARHPTGNHRHAVLMATYDDTLNVDFWRGLAAGDETYELAVDHLPQQSRKIIMSEDSQVDTDDRWKNYKAPAPMVEEIHRQLVEVHGLRAAPDPYAAVYRDWSADPYGGGVNFWNIGVKSWDVIPKMVQPVPHLPVFVCGEAYSDGQGWVEGALQTAEMVLHHLGLPPAPTDGSTS